MAQAGYTPISLYYSTTAAQAPSAGNLVSGELAINITDGKLYFKNASNAVTLLASAAGASGDVVGPASATDNAIVRFDSTTGKLVKNSVVTIADTTGNMSGVGTISSGAITSSSLTSTRVLYAGTSGLIQDSANLTFSGTVLTSTGFSGPLNGSVGATTPSTGAFTTVNGMTLTTSTGTFTLTNGKTFAVQNTITLAGTDGTTMTFPSTTTTVAGLGIAQTFTADQTIAGNLTLNGQGDLRFADSDSSNWVAFQAPATISSNVTWTLPSADGSSGQVLGTNGSGTLSWTNPGISTGKSIAMAMIFGF